MIDPLFIIDPSAEEPIPVYHKVEKAIQERIENAQLAADHPIPRAMDFAGMKGPIRFFDELF